MIKFCTVADYKYVQQTYVCVKIDQNVIKITARDNIFKSNGTGIYDTSQPINVILWQTASQQRLNLSEGCV
jgi:hypothetical protein